MKAIVTLALVNLKMTWRNGSAIFWTIGMPGFIYIALSVLPLGKFIQTGPRYTEFLLPGVLAMAIMQGGIYTLAYWLVDLRARGVLKRFSVTPVKAYEFLSGVILSKLFVAFIQVIVLSLVGVLGFGVLVGWEIFWVIPFVVLGGILFMLIGLIIATFADTYEAAAPITAGIGLPLTFLGNIFYPVEVLPQALQLIAKVLPITPMTEGIRGAFLGGVSSVHQVVLLSQMSIWLIVVALVALKRFKLEN